jgi:putative DNA methylase
MISREIYPKRLIEVDLPINRISEHARREKESRCGHIPRLHIYPAARPLAACRAVLLASICLDPVSKQCPPDFRREAGQLMLKWARDNSGNASAQSLRLLVSLTKKAELIRDDRILQQALLDFIADFSAWDNSVDQAYLRTARCLVDMSVRSLGHPQGSRPLVLDPFAGGGALPLEALRIGCDAFASDLNPVAALIDLVILEHIPRLGADLANELRAWGEWIKGAASDELAKYFRSPTPGEVPIAYLWARTILSEAPGSKTPVEVPLIKTVWLAKKGGLRALRWVRDRNGVVETESVTVHYSNGDQLKVRRPLLEVFEPKIGQQLDAGTVRRMSATCPVTGFTTSADRVRSQLRQRKGGTDHIRAQSRRP